MSIVTQMMGGASGRAIVGRVAAPSAARDGPPRADAATIASGANHVIATSRAPARGVVIVSR